MDYDVQIEKLLNYFRENLSDKNLSTIEELVKNYYRDFNIIGSFIKDYLTLKNNYIECENNKILSNYIHFFEKEKEKIGENALIEELFFYSKCYLILIYEKKFEFNAIDNEAIGYIETINLFYALELYPYLLNKIQKFVAGVIDRNNFISMLKSLVDIVVNKNINSDTSKIDLLFLDYEINKKLLIKDKEFGRLVG